MGGAASSAVPTSVRLPLSVTVVSNAVKQSIRLAIWSLQRASQAEWQP